MRRFPDYPAGLPDTLAEAFLNSIKDGWGREGVASMELLDPSTGNHPDVHERVSRYQRATASPGTMLAMTRMLMDTDVRGALPSIRVPTLVIHRSGDAYIRADHGRYLADHIPDATYIELPGRDHSPEFGDTGAIIARIEEFVTGEPSVVEPDRVLATVLFTDIEASTERAAGLGDRQWATLLDRHEQIAEHQVTRFRGRVVKYTGDGVLAVFDWPARAVECAVALRGALRSINLGVRAGLHTGEIKQTPTDIAGIAVHIAARISALAPSSEIYVSRTVRDLVAGSRLEFEAVGLFALKGVPDPWEVLRVITT